MVADKFNHLFPQSGTYVATVMVTEESAGRIRQNLKSNKRTYYFENEKIKLKWEQHIATTDRIAIQPFCASIDYLPGNTDSFR